MSVPELEILYRVVDRLDKLTVSASADLEWMEKVPTDLAQFEAMSPRRQSAARAFLKSFELVEDQLSRGFRGIPKLLGEDTRRWFARDNADYMERFGILDEAALWGKVVRLRNQLVHDYPLDAQVQFERLIEAIGFLPTLIETHRRLTIFVRTELPGKII